VDRNLKQSNLVSIGLRAKTGRAIAVVLGGSIDAPIVVRKFEIVLTDPKIPGTFQPYHEVMELPWTESQQAVKKFVRAIEAVAQKALANLIRELKSEAMQVAGVGIVGAPDRALERIGNFHIRAHAAEGVLFRHVLDLAAGANRLPWRLFDQKNLEEIAADEFGVKTASLKQKVNQLGRGLPPPWRTPEKQAATAAWLVLQNQAPRSNRKGRNR
jgi:hypothetical protein